MLSFQNPLAFLFLLLIPLLYILRYFKIFEQIKFFAVLSDWDGKSFEWSGKWYNFLYVFSKVLTILGCICVIVAMADPVIKTQEKVYYHDHQDQLLMKRNKDSLKPQPYARIKMA